MCEKFSQSHACDVLRKGEGGRGENLNDTRNGSARRDLDEDLRAAVLKKSWVRRLSNGVTAERKGVEGGGRKNALM